MGLTLSAVSKDYGYNEEKEDYIGEEYLSTDIGYGGFKVFRNNLIKWASNNKLNDESTFENGKFIKGSETPDFFQRNNQNKLYWGFHEEKTYVVAMEDDGDEDDLKNKEWIKYVEKLKALKEQYPKVYVLYPFLAHCDCEGEMPLEQCEQILPLIKEFHKIDNRSYGYSGWEYNFVEDFISILEEVVNHKGKLRFA
ncbi:MAG: hypothetical protein IKF82_00960 [Bacilli bacterium]|nr:hypothetical protein [Bacilli bacterium]